MRAAVAVSPFAFRYVFQGGSTDTTPGTQVMMEFLTQILDAALQPDDIATEMNTSSPEGTVWAVSDYPAPFETRKMVVRWTRAPGVTGAEDVDVIGMHFLKAPGGTPTDAWVDGDYSALETGFDTLWSALKANVHNGYTLSEYRWYADGPAWHPAPAGGNPARRVTSRAVAGGSSAANQLPPQVAESVTFKTDSRRHWGRIYFPTYSATMTTTSGTLTTAGADALRAAWVTFYNTARAAALIPVVYGVGSSTAFGVTSVQVDDLFDVVRRRRWKRASYKTDVALT